MDGTARPAGDDSGRGAPRLAPLTALFLRVGNSTFGGGDAITALLQRELVHRRGWLTLAQFGLAQSVAKMTPGTGILAFSAATAWMLGRGAGAVAAVLAVSVPSSVLVVLLTWAFTSLGGSATAAAVLAAVLAAAVGMMWGAAWLLVRPQLEAATWLRTAVLVAGAFVALSRWSVSPVPILVAAGVIGLVWTSGERA